MGNRHALYLTDRQYDDLLKALRDAKEFRRNRYKDQPHLAAFEAAAVAPISGIEHEIFEQVIVIKAGE